jgi:uncharacterized protein YifE (UPF0438 family)
VCKRRAVALLVALLLFVETTVTLGRAAAASPEEIEAKLKTLQDQVDGLRRELDESRARAATPTPAPPGPAPAAVTVPAVPTERPLRVSDFKIGGYGSTRFEATDLSRLNNTFTFRRFVLSGDATIGERLRSVVELEFERLTELEVERTAPSEDGRRGFSQSIEGSDKSEISLEQAWAEFTFAEWARLRAGMMLVPFGRFNLNHDDNKWDLPRRSLVDRGVSVLPVKAAWSEVGMGLVGDIPTENWGKFAYQAFVMNGVTLDSSIETFARGSSELEAEVEIQPRRGTANIDVKRDKAGAVRLSWSPEPATEIGASAYYGRYTPDFLPSESVWAIGLDGKTGFGPFEIEGEYILTRYNGIRGVARGFAAEVANRAFTAGTPLEVAVEFELAGLADTKHGYWLDLRYRFFPDFLRDTPLGKPFENPQFIVTLRGEQVWLNGLVKEIDFSGGNLTSIERENRWVDRVTLGFAYRPVPLFVIQAALERTWTNSGKSLAAVTNFLPARRSEDTANAFLFGIAFGF